MNDNSDDSNSFIGPSKIKKIKKEKKKAKKDKKDKNRKNRKTKNLKKIFKENNLLIRVIGKQKFEINDTIVIKIKYIFFKK